MLDLRAQLQQCFEGRVCLLGLGNPDFGDDAFGVRLAEALARWSADPETGDGSGVRSKMVVAGTSPERFLGRITDWQHVIFLDAVECGAAPGSIVFMNAAELATRFPQISTHKISLGLLAKWVESQGHTRAWLLGVQPESLAPGRDLTSKVQATLDALLELLDELMATQRQDYDKACATAGVSPRQPPHHPHHLEAPC